MARSNLVRGGATAIVAAALSISGQLVCARDRARADFPYPGHYGATTMAAGRVLDGEPLGGLVVPLRGGGSLRYGYCITFGKYAPGNAVRYGVPRPFSGTNANRDRATIGLMSMLIQRYGHKPGSGGADAVDIAAAEVSATLSHTYDEVDRNGQWRHLGRGGTSVAHARRLVDLVRSVAGPFSIDEPDLPTAVPGGTYRYLTTVRNAYGPVGRGVRVSLKATGAHLVATQASTDSKGRIAVSYTVPAGATSSRVRITASAGVIDTMRVLRQASSTAPGQVQDFVFSGTAASVYRSTSQTPVDHPTMRTQTSAQVAVVGTSLTDVITVSGAAGVTGSITATLYGPAPTADGPWEARAGTVSVHVEGNGRYTTPPIKVDAAGYYSWGEVFVVSGASTPVATTAPGEVSETTVVTQPAMHTRASDQRAVVGSALTDTVVVTGTAGMSGVVHATLFGPASSPRGPWTTEAGSIDFPVDGDGSYVTAPIVVTRPGVYSWAESLTLDGSARPIATTPPGDAVETTTVTQPTMRTQTSAQRAEVGARLTDDIVVAGTSGASGFITATLYGPAASMHGPWTRTVATVHLRVTGDGTYTTPSVRLTEAGIYTWTESLTMTGQTTPAATTEAGETTETTIVTAPPTPPGHGIRIETGGERGSGGSMLGRVAGWALASGAIGALAVAVRRRRT